MPHVRRREDVEHLEDADEDREVADVLPHARVLELVERVDEGAPVDRDDALDRVGEEDGRAAGGGAALAVEVEGDERAEGVAC